VITNSDFVGIEDLKVLNMVKNRKLAKSISNARLWGTQTLKTLLERSPLHREVLMQVVSLKEESAELSRVSNFY